MFFAKLIFVCATIVLVSGSPQYGAPRTLDATELEAAKVRLQSSLTKLAAGDGPHYSIARIISSETQVVSGHLDTYVAELVDTQGGKKVCTVKVWSRSWGGHGYEVTFECPNEQAVTKKHN
ncbi:CG15369 [Drosophila busckii]|uniref:CG15369 n=1 Tax=Drosophila busckii TaxID=30019 RepID=A0A0M4EIV8_DROBS|nr:sarcocystatin-A [Drosophila busckii]ALC48928.1 CG15369 [Drosophila busckii]